MRPTHFVVFSVICLAAPTGGAVVASTPSTQRPAKECAIEPIAPASGQRLSRFLAWYREHEESGREPDAGLEVRFADIDNDGVEEAVVSSLEGSPDHLFYEVFKPSGKAWRRVELHADLEHGDVEPVSRDPLSRELFFLTRCCGRTYINLNRIWERSKVRKACDVPLLEAERRVFKRTFDRGSFHAAYDFLADVKDLCSADAEGPTSLWIESDLALSAYHMERYATCLKHVAAAQKSRDIARATNALRKALATNESLCAKANKKPRGVYDYSWLYELKRDHGTQIMDDPRFESLVNSVVPDDEFQGAALRDRLEVQMEGRNPPQFLGDRYVVLSGWMPHSAGSTAGIWIDTATKRSIAWLRCNAPEEPECVLASFMVDSGSIPHEFWQQTDLWGSKSSVFREPSGKWTTIQPPPSPNTDQSDKEP